MRQGCATLAHTFSEVSVHFRYPGRSRWQSEEKVYSKALNLRDRTRFVFVFFFFVAISVLIGIDTVTSVGSDTSVVLLCGQNYPAFAHAQEKGKHLSGPLPGHHFAAWEEEI